ncbi:glycerate kinase [Orussus abietinus]|uniref:glycerate kinase n=1 Tax=Orussus abietinus TaxID=222816 RepID=UPI0006261F4A|nr:glycerate kinase [Orussus abietinus]
MVMESLSRAKVILKEMFDAAVEAVLPNRIIKNRVKVIENQLLVDKEAFRLKGNVYLIGFGKAVMGMAIEMENLLGDKLKKGIVSIPRGSKENLGKIKGMTDLTKSRGVVIYREGCVNNQPDSASLSATAEIIDLVTSLKETDTLIVLVSGGGSALLCMPKAPIEAKSKEKLCKDLQNAGANIKELNTIRMKLSAVKGGGLARMAYPTSVISLILSDIVNDLVDIIASGPTIYNSKSTKIVIEILEKYKLYDALENDLKSVLTSNENADEKYLLNERKEFTHVKNIIIGNNTLAIQSAFEKTSKKGLNTIVLGNNVEGHVRDVSLRYVDIIETICLTMGGHLSREEFFTIMEKDSTFSLSETEVEEIFNRIINSGEKEIVLVAGGEPTVVVTGKGLGGRNQQLTFQFSFDWHIKVQNEPRLGEYNVIIMSCGTDGQDGPTDAAGAFGYAAIHSMVSDMYNNLKKKLDESQDKSITMDIDNKLNIDAQEIKNMERLDVFPDLKIDYRNRNSLAEAIKRLEQMSPDVVLRKNDTYNFYSQFKGGQDLIKTGVTGTNVMDLHFFYIKKV